jgi:hypothetical protein
VLHCQESFSNGTTEWSPTLSAMGVGGGAGGGVEWRGAAPTCCTSKVDRGGGSSE